MSVASLSPPMAASGNQAWFRQSSGDVLNAWSANPESGLDSAEAARRLAEHGPNELVESKGRSLGRILFDQAREILVVILILAVAVSFALGENTDGSVILAILVLNIALGAAQEFRAERAIAALKRLAAPSVRV